MTNEEYYPINNIEISEEYREFLIDSFSRYSESFFNISKIRDDIYTKEYSPIQLAMNKYRIPKERFEYYARKVVLHQTLNLSRLDYAIRKEFEYDPAYYFKNQMTYEDYFSYCGIILKGSLDFLDTVILTKTQEQLDNIFYSIKNNKINYLQEFYSKYYTIIIDKREWIKKEKENEKLHKEKEEIKTRLLEKERKKQLKNEAFQELIEEGRIFNVRKSNENKREPIPKEIMNQVWNRDGGACVQCGSRQSLEFDHIIPFSKGGSTTYRNLQLLCRECNSKKSNNIG